MEKVKLALNYALMIEMIKAKETDTGKIITLLEEGNEEELRKFGEGIPSWSTMTDFFHENTQKCEKAINEGYEITFLTKGALKSLLSIKFQMEEGRDFKDAGFSLDQVKITSEHLHALRSVISRNWTIVELDRNTMNHDRNVIKIELTNKPIV